MSCRPAPACQAALDEASRRWPWRRTSSDGTCASPDHRRRSPVSDHNPNAEGLATAYDLSHDPSHGVNCGVLSRYVIHDRRTKYVIFNRQIWSREQPYWRVYSGDSPHTEHMHVSVLRQYEYDTSPWFSSSPSPSTGTEADLTLAEHRMLQAVYDVIAKSQTTKEVGALLGEMNSKVDTIYNRVTAIEDKLGIKHT